MNWPQLSDELLAEQVQHVQNDHHVAHKVRQQHFQSFHQQLPHHSLNDETDLKVVGMKMQIGSVQGRDEGEIDDACCNADDGHWYSTTRGETYSSDDSSAVD